MRVEKSADIFSLNQITEIDLITKMTLRSFKLTIVQMFGEEKQCVLCAIETISTRTVSDSALFILLLWIHLLCIVRFSDRFMWSDPHPPHPTAPTPPADHNKQESTKRKTDKHRGGQHARRCTHRAPRTAAQKAKCTTLLSPAKRLLV